MAMFSYLISIAGINAYELFILTVVKEPMKWNVFQINTFRRIRNGIWQTFLPNHWAPQKTYLNNKTLLPYVSKRKNRIFRKMKICVSVPRTFQIGDIYLICSLVSKLVKRLYCSFFMMICDYWIVNNKKFLKLILFIFKSKKTPILNFSAWSLFVYAEHILTRLKLITKW